MTKKIKHALVLGLGASGRGAVRLLLAEGVPVTAVDAQPVCDAARSLEKDGAHVLAGCSELPGGSFDLAVVSPGIAEDHPWMTSLKERGIPCISELELGWSRCRGRVWAITGSNGKSTLVKCCADSLAKAGRRARIAGNYGLSFCEQVAADPSADDWVLEVSSFQLETVCRFRPDIGILLNVLPNHLDRHGTMHHYLELKLRMFARMRPKDVCIVPAPLAWACGRSAVTFGPEEAAQFRWLDGRVVHDGKPVADFMGTLFDNDVMGPSLAALSAAFAGAAVDLRFAEEAIRSFDPLPHRMQPAGAARGVEFVNNSKATNIAALAASLQMTGKPVRLIAGGQAKEERFEEIKDLLAKRVQSAYLIGRDSEKMSSAWSGAVPCSLCGNLEQAVRAAWADARHGEVVLLAPACTSYDQFRDFAERGEQFMRLAAALVKETENEK